jgi:hypothetical protein
MNPDELLWEEVRLFVIHRAPLLDSFCRDGLQNLTELRGCSTELGVVPINGEKIWPELGFRPEWARERERREGWRSRVLRWRCRGSYRPPREVAQILAQSTAGSSTASCLADRRLKTTVFPSVGPPCQPIPNRYPYVGRMLGRLGRLRPGKLLPPFLCFDSFPISVFYLLIWILIWIHFVLQVWTWSSSKIGLDIK